MLCCDLDEYAEYLLPPPRLCISLGSFVYWPVSEHDYTKISRIFITFDIGTPRERKKETVRLDSGWAGIGLWSFGYARLRANSDIDHG